MRKYNLSLDSLCGILHKIRCMRNFIKYIVLTGCILLSLSSCSERQKLRKTMSKFVQTEIQIPDDLECVYNREVTIINKDTLKPYKLIVYYDSLDCSSCRISHLMDLYPLYDMADTCGFSLLTIFSPRMDQVDEVRLQLMLTNSPAPIYLDINSSFRRQNSLIPSDLRLHKFLLGPNNNPVFVGDPLANEKLSELFRTVLIKPNIINN